MSGVEPAAFSDIDAWDRHHAATSMGERIEAARRALRYVPDLEANRLRRVWFPGCGTSLAPRAYAELGFDVVASDLSSDAVDAQWQSSVGVSAELLGMLYEQAVSGLAPERGGKLSVVKHDLAEPFTEADFDAVLNIRSFVGFAPTVMQAIATSHHTALRPGGWAIFEARGVAVRDRDRIDDLLLGAGFVMPLNDCDRWYRRELEATGLPVLFKLGHPRVDPEQGYEEQPGDQQRLDEIEQSYLDRRRQRRVEEGSPPGDARLAFALFD